jgi:hypothetical protein
MSSDRSAPGLGAHLRASAQEPEDHAAAELRARLRHKMFGVGAPVAPPPSTLPPDVHVEPRPQGAGLSRPLLLWAVPFLAVVGLAAMMLWRRHGRSGELPHPIALPPTLEISPPVVPPSEHPVPADVGPAALARAQTLTEPEAQIDAVADAVRAAWAEPTAADRIEATVEVATAYLGRKEPRRAIALLRAVLDDLELRRGSQAARAKLLRGAGQADRCTGGTGRSRPPQPPLIQC